MSSERALLWANYGERLQFSDDSSSPGPVRLWKHSKHAIKNLSQFARILRLSSLHSWPYFPRQMVCLQKACLRLCSGTSLLYLAMDQVHSISTYIMLVQSGAFLCMFGPIYPASVEICWDMLRSIIGTGATFCSECLILAKFPGQVCPGQGSTGSTGSTLGSTLDNAALCCQPKNMREPAAQKRPRQLRRISCTRDTRCMAMTYLMTFQIASWCFLFGVFHLQTRWRTLESQVVERWRTEIAFEGWAALEALFLSVV